MIWKGWLKKLPKNNITTLLNRQYFYTFFLSLFGTVLFAIPCKAQVTADPAMVDSNAINNLETIGRDSTGTDTTGNVTIPIATQKTRGDSSATTITPTDTTVRALTDTSNILDVKKPKRHSPLKAALFSIALPGLGQGYNKKYWKIPIVYAGFGGLSYALYFTATEFKGYRNAYRLEVDDNPNTNGSYKGSADAATLKVYRDYYKRYLDVSSICMAVWYTLTIVDATVDAHLFEWNMKDDISLSWHPVMMNTGYSPASAFSGGGIMVNLNF